MATAFDWSTLSTYKGAGGFLDGVSADYRTFWSPVDNIHGLLVALLGSAQHSVVLNMYGFTDVDLAQILDGHLKSPNIYVQISLDSSQLAGRTEASALTELRHDAAGTSIAIGESVRHAISHLKVLIVDGTYTVSGSANWSISGEGLQDNQLLLSRDPVMAAEYRSVLDRNHTEMLRQMAEKASKAG